MDYSLIKDNLSTKDRMARKQWVPLFGGSTVTFISHMQWLTRSMTVCISVMTLGSFSKL